MIKKTLITAASLMLLSMLFLGRDAFSYVRTSFGCLKDTVKSNVPIEFEIERARSMVKNLLPDIRKNMHVIAQEEVEIERLTKQIEQTTALVEKDKTEVLRLKNDLTIGKVSYQYAGRTYTAEQVKVDLSNRFERLKTHEATLASLRDIQKARLNSLDAARQKLDGMMAARRDLEVTVENLEARWKMIEVAQTTSQYNIDDSQLGRVKDLIAEVKTRLNVAERLCTAEAQMTGGGEIPLSSPYADNILDQVTEYFADSAAKVAETPALTH